MTTGTYILKNALRNKRRAALSVLSVAVSLFLFVTLLVALRELTIPPEDVGSSLRIIVRNKVSLAQLLPAKQHPRIERIGGVVGVTPLTFFGGNYKGDEKFTSFAQFAVDPAALGSVAVDARIDPTHVQAWIADRATCLVGVDTAKRYGITIGDRMKFTGTFYPCDLDLRVVGFYSGTSDDRTVFFHHKHLDELLGDPGTVGAWWVRAASPAEAPGVVERINAAFASTSAEVRAETERAFQLSFVSMWANIKVLIGSICTVVVFTLLLVSVSTMSMAIRERFRELAVLKAIGFRGELFAFILAESFGLAMAGALLGAGGAWWLYNHAVDIQKLTNGIFLTFEVTPRHLGLSFAVAAGLGILSALAPCLNVARTSVVEGLRTLD